MSPKSCRAVKYRAWNLSSKLIKIWLWGGLFALGGCTFLFPQSPVTPPAVDLRSNLAGIALWCPDGTITIESLRVTFVDPTIPPFEIKDSHCPYEELPLTWTRLAPPYDLKEGGDLFPTAPKQIEFSYVTSTTSGTKVVGQCTILDKKLPQILNAETSNCRETESRSQASTIILARLERPRVDGGMVLLMMAEASLCDDKPYECDRSLVPGETMAIWHKIMAHPPFIAIADIPPSALVVAEGRSFFAAIHAPANQPIAHSYKVRVSPKLRAKGVEFGSAIAVVFEDGILRAGRVHYSPWPRSH